MEDKIRYLKKAAEDWDAGNAPDVRKILMAVVSTFCDPRVLNEKVDVAEEMWTV